MTTFIDLTCSEMDESKDELPTTLPPVAIDGYKIHVLDDERRALFRLTENYREAQVVYETANEHFKQLRSNEAKLAEMRHALTGLKSDRRHHRRALENAKAAESHRPYDTQALRGLRRAIDAYLKALLAVQEKEAALLKIEKKIQTWRTQTKDQKAVLDNAQKTLGVLEANMAIKEKEVKALISAVTTLWKSWSAEERIQHFEAADFDFGLFSKKPSSPDTPNIRMTELLQALAEVRPQIVPPREDLLEVLVKWVQSSIWRLRATEFPLWGEIMTLREN